MQFSTLAALLALANAAANAEADPMPCLWLKAKLGLCGGGGWGGNNGGYNNGGRRATMIVYTTVTPAPQTATVTAPSTVTTTIQQGGSCRQGDTGANGAVCGNDNTFTVQTTQHRTVTSTANRDTTITANGAVQTQTIWKEVCASTVTVCK